MIVIHGIFGSPFVRALRIALAEKALRWGWAPLALGDHTKAPYTLLHPFGKIPAVVDGDMTLYETNAILRHIERIAPDPALIPADPRHAARMDQMLCILDCYLWPNAARPINFNRLVAPRIGRPVDDAAVAAGVPHAETALHALDTLWTDGDFLAGDALSLADIALLPHLDALRLTAEGGAIMARTPRLLAWLDRMGARRSVQDSLIPPEKLLQAA
jgi:glutathione S-transferase